MTHPDVALMIGLGFLLSFLCMLAVFALDWLQRQRQPRDMSDEPAVLRKAKP